MAGEVARDAALRHLHTCVVAAITSTAHGAPSEVEVGVEDGLKRGSVIKLDHLFTVPQSDLRQWLGHLHEAKLSAVCRALAIALGCSAAPEH